MKILLDQCVPVPLANYLLGLQTQTAYDLGWASLRNGELLTAAVVGGIDVFITSDKNLRYQQNLTGRQIAILELPTNNWRVLQRLVTEIADAVASIQPGEYRELKLGTQTP